MTSRPFIRLLLVALALACSGLPARAAAPTAGATAKPAPGKSGPAKPGDPPAVDPFETVRVKIDQLLKARINPEPLPAVLPNPFTLPNAAVAPTGDDDLAPAEVPVPAAAAAEGPEPGGDKEILAKFAETLKVGGLVQFNGQTSLYINRLLYREGDVLLMDKRDPKSAVKIVRIAPGALTLGFNAATHVIRVKN